jgi:uncharacterized protein
MHRWFTPRECVAGLQDVDPAALSRRGIRGVLLDLDNTLVAWKRSELEPEMEEWVRAALADGLKICIVSNTWRRTRIHAIAEKLGVPYILRAWKPRRGSLRRAMDVIATRPSETAVIGDQIVTDVVGGNRIGAYTVLCVPMPGQEFIGTGVVRHVERYLTRRMVKSGRIVLPTPLPPKEPAE